MVSKGFLPGWEEANEMCPGVCQSWVRTTCSKTRASRLIMGTTWSPSFTARDPPGTKQFCTSTTRSTSCPVGFIFAPPCAAASGTRPAPPAMAMPPTTFARNPRRLDLVMAACRPFGQYRSEDEDTLARGLGVEELVGLHGLIQLEVVREELLEGHAALDDEVGALLLAGGAERPRGVDRQLAAQHVLADVERGRAALAHEAHAPPGPRAAHRGHARGLLAGAVHRGLRALAVGQVVDGLDGIDLLRVQRLVGAHLLGQGQPLGSDVDGDDPRPHGLAEHGGAEPDRTLAEDGEGVAPGDVQPLEGAVGCSRAARDGRTLLEAHLRGKRHHRAGRRLHVGGVGPVAGHPVDDALTAAELRPANPAVAALAAAVVVVVHDPIPYGEAGHARPQGAHHAAGLMPRDDRITQAAQPERGRRAPGRAVRVQIAPAHAGGLDGDDGLAGSRGGVGKIAKFERAVAEEDDAAHRLLPLVSFEAACPS